MNEIERLSKRTDQAAMDLKEAQRKGRNPEVIERYRRYWLDLVVERDHAIYRAEH